jgi:hypothetical protein
MLKYNSKYLRVKRRYKKMIYDYNHYNDPKKGNKHIYAFGECYESIEYCGFIHADTKRQAQTVLDAHNRKWDDYGCILLDYTEEECKAEIERRAKKKGKEKLCI